MGLAVDLLVHERFVLADGLHDGPELANSGWARASFRVSILPRMGGAP